MLVTGNVTDQITVRFLVLDDFSFMELETVLSDNGHPETAWKLGITSMVSGQNFSIGTMTLEFPVLDRKAYIMFGDN